MTSIEDEQIICNLFIECSRTQRLHPFIHYFFQAVITFFIDTCIDREIGGRGGYAFCNLFNKIFLGCRLHGIILLLLITNRTLRFRTKIFTTGTAGSMRRINDHVIRQREQFLVNTFIQHTSQVRSGQFCSFLCQVRTTHIPNK